MCAALCEPSTRMTAPSSCATAAISLTGLMRPRTFETSVTATIFVFFVIFFFASSTESLPSFSRYMYFKTAPFAWATICHGTRFE